MDPNEALKMIGHLSEKDNCCVQEAASAEEAPGSSSGHEESSYFTATLTGDVMLTVSNVKPGHGRKYSVRGKPGGLLEVIFGKE